MAFPNTLDDFTPKVDNTNDVMAIDVNELQTAIEALEDKVGVNNSAVTTSHDYKIKNLEVTKQDYIQTPITPLTVKGGVVRVIDDATGDIARTTSGWIEDEKYGWYMFVSAGGISAEFDTVVLYEGKKTLKVSTTDITGKAVVQNSAVSIEAERHGIIVKPSTNYKLTIPIKTANGIANGWRVQVNRLNSSYVNTGSTYTSYVTGDSAMDVYTVLFTTEATSKFLRIVPQCLTAGNISSAWFGVNSMTLEEVSTITNSGSAPALLYPKVTAVTSNDNIDQSQVVSDNTSRIGEPATVWIAQQFTPTKKNLTSFVIRHGTETGTYTGNVTVSIQADSGSTTPSGTDLGTPVTIANADWKAITADTDYSIYYPLTLTIGGTYWVVIKSSTSDNSNYTRLRSQTTAGYSGGVKKVYNGSAWSAASTDELYFKTLYSKNTTNFTVSTDTETISVTAPTPDGWADGTVIDTAGLGITPLTLAPGVNNVYYSSNGPATADGTVDASLQAIVAGTQYGRGQITQFSSGTTAPSSTPVSVGQMYVDTTAKKVYVSTGTSSSSDWKILN